MTRRTWTVERIARLAFLVGMGRSVEAIAADPLVHTSPASVYRQANRLGLSIPETRGTIRFQMPGNLSEALEAEAHKRGMSVDALCLALMIESAKSPALIPNILDEEAA